MKEKFFIIIFVTIMVQLFFSSPSVSQDTDNTPRSTEALPVEIEKTPLPAQTEQPAAQVEITENEKQRREIADLKKRIEELEEKTDLTYGLKVSGFFDVYMSNYKNQPNIFEIGAFELDLQHTYKEHLEVAAALVFDNGAELGVGFIDYHLYGSTINPRGRLFQDEGLHLQVGKFDIPVGNDWQYFSAINRVSVTLPLTTDMVMDGGYNDVGIRMLWKHIAANVSLYALRGIEEGYSYGGNSFGGRVAVTPFNTPYLLKSRSASPLEIGFSYIHDLNKAGATSEQLYAVDAESGIGPFNLSGEYYLRDKKAGIIHQGFQITGYVDFLTILKLPFKVYTRFDQYMMKRYEKVSEKNMVNRIGGGVNITIYKVSVLKLEYLQFIKTYDTFMEEQYYSPRLYYLQLMISF